MPENKRNREQSESLKELRGRLEAESNDGLKLLRNIKDNPICSLSFDNTIPCIVVTWKQYATSTQLRFIHENIILLLETHRASKILGLDTALPTIHNEDQTWIVENWMPRAIAAGLKATASKNPSSYFCKVSIDAIQAVRPAGLAFRSFDDTAEARQWLKSQSA